MIKSSPKDGLLQINIRRYRGLASIQTIVNRLNDALQSGMADVQFLAFENFTKDDLAKIDDSRHIIGKSLRMSHYEDTSLLIVKLMPSVTHATAHLWLSRKFNINFERWEFPMIPLSTLSLVVQNGFRR